MKKRERKGKVGGNHLSWQRAMVEGGQQGWFVQGEDGMLEERGGGDGGHD